MIVSPESNLYEYLCFVLDWIRPKDLYKVFKNTGFVASKNQHSFENVPGQLDNNG